MKILKLITVLSLSFNIYISKAQYIAPDGISYKDDKSLYYFGTAIFTTVNGTTIYFNIKKLHQYDKYRSNALFGALSGGTQTAIGFIELKNSHPNTVLSSALNISSGLTTLITSVLRLATKNSPKNNMVGLHLFYVPSINGSNSLWSFSLRKQIK
jgi:hypothetical protein